MMCTNISIFDYFIKRYLYHQNQIQKERAIYGNESNIHEFYYYLIKKLLYDQFKLTTKINLEIIPNRIKNDKSFQEFVDKYSSILSQEFINQFDYDLKERLNDQIKITPYIFSLIFEYSQFTTDKQKIGLYYTSNIEIYFMCREVLTNYLIENTNINEKLIIDLIGKKQNEIHNYNLEKIRNALNLILERIRILDPCCGSGGFIIGMVLVILELYKKINSNKTQITNTNKFLRKLIETNLFGVDIQAESLLVTKLRLLLLASIYNQDLLNTHNFQFNLQQKNILLANNNELFPRNNKIAYDIIIGNPPFIRQEGHVEEFPGNLTHSEYKEKILTKIENNSFPLKLPRDKKSDFYIYFFYRGISLLKKNGVMCFITPNSWLDVIYGINFKKILLNNFHLKHIYSNNQIKSFRSSINSIISVLIKKHDNNFLPTKFVQFNSNFNDLQRWDLVFNQIIFENYIEDANLQIKTIDRNQLISNLKNQFDFRNKWSSSYFRSPKILTELFNRKPNKFVNLGSIGKIRYSMKTGLNEYFIIDNDIIEKFRIENEFLVPLIKSPKNIKKIQIIKKDLEKRVFNCKMSMETLVKNRKVGALAYINWGKKQRTNKKQQSKGNERYPDVPTVKSHFPYWYSLREVKQADIFCNRFFDKRFYFSFSDDYVIEDQTFYGLKLKEELRKEKMLIIALLNSTLSYLILEVFGRTTLGRGALQYSINDLNMLPILNPRKISNDDKIKIIDKFKPILSRQIKSIFNECESKDRQEFDLAILNWLGLDKNNLSELYLSLLNLVRNRLKKSVQKMSFY